MIAENKHPHLRFQKLVHLLVGFFRSQEFVHASQVFQHHAMEDFLCEGLLLCRVETGETRQSPS